MKQILGIDYLGSQNYVDFLCKNHPKGFAAGFLVKADGWKSGLIAVRALAKTGKCPVMRIHGQWHDDHRFSEKDIPQAVKTAEQIAKIAERFPDIKFFYSPWLEGHATQTVMRACKKACRKVLPRKVKLVSSVNMPKGYNEVHHGGPIAGKYIFSYDGLDMFKTNHSSWQKAHLGAEQFYAWIPQCNGYTYCDVKVPRWERTDWLTKAQLDKMVDLLKK